MSKFIGIALIIAGVLFGFWAGLWWAFIGGIINIIEQVRAPIMDLSVIAFGILKIMCAGLIGWAAAVILIIPGMVFLDFNVKTKRYKSRKW